MTITYWTRFGTSPVALWITGLIAVVMFVYILAQAARIWSVKGTRGYYQASTVARTLCLPLFGALTFEVAIDLFTGHWVSAVLEAYLAFIMLRDWERMKDNDDWWTGRGEKLKKKLRSMLSASSPAAAGA
jgi:hypothetical protein